MGLHTRMDDMSGFTKYKYEQDCNECKNIFSKYVKSIEPLMPFQYKEDDLITLVKKYYPFEYRIWNEKFKSYQKWDKTLKSTNGKTRYNARDLDYMILHLSISKRLLSESYRIEHNTNFSEKEREERELSLAKARNPKIQKRQKRIDTATLRMQKVEPEYLDALMGFYDRKNTSQKDRMYIMIELEKYYCPKVISFFQKTAHSELNFQLRERAVKHLLSLGHYAELRRQKYMRIHTQNRKRKAYLKEYAKERFDIEGIPMELEYRINNSKDQRIIGYDFFISHSSSDFEAVQSVITALNDQGKVIYCDWINDTDYLKRHLVGEATLNVIKKRIEKADAVLLIESAQSTSSLWVKYELNYAYSLGKRICVLPTEDIKKSKFQYSVLKNRWFYDEHYEEMKLF